MKNPTESHSYDVLVIGGGHAGSEAALVAARMGCRTALLTLRGDRIGQMSCNPAIGGLGKGQLVKEIDALFGEMGVAIDDTGVQFRTLNSSKGPAVRSSRAQADRDKYCARITGAVHACPGLDVIEAPVGRLEMSGSTVRGVYTEGGVFIGARAVIVTTGTFLRALMHTGAEKAVGGRVGDGASYALSDSLKDLGLRMGRMKTGTPARLKRSSIDYSALEEQPGETPIKPFSFRTKTIDRPQLSCWMTATTAETHAVIAENFERSPMFNGQIQSRGPRYCPSVEDKIFRFKDKESHNIFLEPEGFESDIVYPNGISTSLPAEVQDAFIRTIPGLRDVVILQYGYAVEYDHIDPTELGRDLSPKDFTGLYFAGQINGTSGYEEAGAQGLIAGINAARFCRDEEPVVLGREEAYLGVMVDDLTTLGISEPYRMFTSRAEYRLQLREDNADARLTPLARKLGLVSDSDWGDFERRQDRIAKERRRLETTVVKPSSEVNRWLDELGTAHLADAVPLATLLRRPEIGYGALRARFPDEVVPGEAPGLSSDAPEELLTDREAYRLETEIKFEGYFRRQAQDIERVRKMELMSIPASLNYSSIQGLSVEVREKLAVSRPGTVGQASRISGVTPAAVSLIAIHLKRLDAER